MFLKIWSPLNIKRSTDQKKIDFGDVKIIRGAPTLNVFLVDPDGNFVTATYLMQQQPDLSWLISGCYLKTSDFEQI